MNRINIICLGVRDIAKSMDFYKRIGFYTRETNDSPPVVFFDTRGTKLELYPLEALAQDIGAQTPPPVAGGFSGITLACNMKSKQEVDDYMALVEKEGAAIVKRPRTVFWGGYSGYFRDPDGYYWEVAYAPGSRFDDNDMLILQSMS